MSKINIYQHFSKYPYLSSQLNFNVAFVQYRYSMLEKFGFVKLFIPARQLVLIAPMQCNAMHLKL